MPRSIAEGVYVLIDVGASMRSLYKGTGKTKIDVAIECAKLLV